jgi:hypothetical protein
MARKSCSRHRPSEEFFMCATVALLDHPIIAAHMSTDYVHSFGVGQCKLSYYHTSASECGRKTKEFEFRN